MSDTRSRAGVGAAVTDEFRVPYGGHPDECLHYVPAPGDGAAAMVFVGDGACDHDTIDTLWHLAAQATAAGHAFVVVHTSRRDEVEVDTLVDQTRRAVGWVIDHPELGHSPEQVAVIGHRSGAHLAAMVAAHDPRPYGYVLVSGTYELSSIGPSDATCVVAWTDGDPPDVQRQGQALATRWTMSHWNRSAVPVHVAGRDRDDVLLDLFDDTTPLGAAVREIVSRTRTT